MELRLTEGCISSALSRREPPGVCVRLTTAYTVCSGLPPGCGCTSSRRRHVSLAGHRPGADGDIYRSWMSL